MPKPQYPTKEGIWSKGQRAEKTYSGVKLGLPYKEVYESDFWAKEVKPGADEMLDRETMRVTRLEATPKSVIH